MSKTIDVTPVEVALEAIKNNPDGFLVFRKKQKQSEYTTTKFNIGGKLKDGWISAKDVAIFAAADPNDKKDPRNDKNNSRNRVDTSIKRAGPLGEFIKLLEPVWQKAVQKMLNDGMIKLTSKQEIHKFFHAEYSADDKKGRTGIIEDPWIKFKIDWKKYSPDYFEDALKGQPKTVILDYDKPIKDENGRISYAPATVVVDGEEVPVSEENFHLFLNEGAVIKYFRIKFEDAVSSQGWYSMPVLSSRMIVKTGSNYVGFTDDFECDDELMQNLSVEKPVVTGNNVNNNVNNNNSPKNNEEISVNTTNVDVTEENQDDAVSDLLKGFEV